MKKGHHLWFAAATVGIAIAATPGLAQQGGGDSPYASCAAIAEDSARLACFDATFAKEDELKAEQAEVAKQEKVETFGLSELDIQRREDIDDSASQPAEDGQITATVIEIFADRQIGKRLFVLDNGQIWRENQISRMKRNPRVGQTVTISKESLGRFYLRVDGKRGFVDVLRMR